MSIEEWIPAAGYVGRYEVSSLGRVRSLLTGKSLTPVVATTGYLTLCLQGANHQQRSELLHRLILRSFAGNAPDNHECAHLDGIKANCALNNLKWVTHKENSAHRKIHGSENTPSGEAAGQAKLCYQDVQRIKEASLFGATRIALARIYGVSSGCISNIVLGKNWKILTAEFVQ